MAVSICCLIASLKNFNNSHAVVVVVPVFLAE